MELTDYRYAASLTSTVQGVARVTIGIGQKRIRPSNDLVLLVFERPLVTRGPCSPMYLVVSKSSEFVVNVSSGIIFSSAVSKLFRYIKSCDVRLLLFIGCFVFNW